MPGENLSDACSFEFESFEVEVAGAEGVFKGVGDVVDVAGEGEACVVGGFGSFAAEMGVDFSLEVAAEDLESVFEEKTHKVSSQFESLVAVVVLVVNFLGVFVRFYDSSDHESEVAGF